MNLAMFDNIMTMNNENNCTTFNIVGTRHEGGKTYTKDNNLTPLPKSSRTAFRKTPDNNITITHNTFNRKVLYNTNKNI